MKIEMDLYSPEQMEAFAVFLNASAVARRNEYANKVAAGMSEPGCGALRPTGYAQAVQGDVATGNAAPAVITEDVNFGEAAAAEPAKRTRRTKAQIDAEAKPQEARQPAPEPEAIQEQDAADEAAESAAAKAEDPSLTLDDVRSAMGKYVTAYGMAAAQEDGPKLFQLAFGPGIVKMSQIPPTQEALKKAVAATAEMIEKNPYKRTADL